MTDPPASASASPPPRLDGTEGAVSQCPCVEANGGENDAAASERNGEPARSAGAVVAVAAKTNARKKNATQKNSKQKVPPALPQKVPPVLPCGIKLPLPRNGKNYKKIEVLKHAVRYGKKNVVLAISGATISGERCYQAKSTLYGMFPKGCFDETTVRELLLTYEEGSDEWSRQIKLIADFEHGPDEELIYNMFGYDGYNKMMQLVDDVVAEFEDGPLEFPDGALHKSASHQGSGAPRTVSPLTVATDLYQDDTSFASIEGGVSDCCVTQLGAESIPTRAPLHTDAMTATSKCASPRAVAAGVAPPRADVAGVAAPRADAAGVAAPRAVAAGVAPPQFE